MKLFKSYRRPAGRLASAALLLALCALTLFHILRMPYNPEKLRQAVPASATMMSAHHNLAARYETLATNIFLRQAVLAAGIDPERLPPEAAAQLRRYAPYVAGADTLAAWLPKTPNGNGPGLVIVSWMGRAGLAARWLLEWRMPRQLQRQPPFVGHPIWHSADPINPAGWRLAFTISEGMLLALIAPNPDGLREVIMASERLAPSVNQKLDRDFPALPAEAADRIWLRRTPRLAAAITEITSEQLAATIHAADYLPNAGVNLQKAELETPGVLLGDTPTLALVAHADSARRLAAYLPTIYTALIGELLAPDASIPATNCLGLAVLTGADGGGFGQTPWRVSIPALLGFVRINHPANAHVIIRRMLDQINAIFKLGLIVDAGAPVTGKPLIKIFTIEPTTDNFLARLAADDRPAYAILDEWLIFSSNAGALTRRLAGMPTKMNNAAAHHETRWLTAVKDAPASAMLWMDMQTGGRALQLGLTGLTLARRGTHPHDPAPAWIDIARHWLTDMQAMRAGALRLDPETPALRLKIAKE